MIEKKNYIIKKIGKNDHPYFVANDKYDLKNFKYVSMMENATRFSQRDMIDIFLNNENIEIIEEVCTYKIVKVDINIE